jgi:hypothetical protein
MFWISHLYRKMNSNQNQLRLLRDLEAAIRCLLIASLVLRRLY